MTTHPTEDDLRSALDSLAPSEPEMTDFRARLDVLVADTGTDADARVGPDAGPAEDARAVPLGSDSSVVLPLLPLPARRRPRRNRLVLAATVAACAATIVAVVVALVPGSDHQPTAASGTGVPAAVRPHLLPDMTVIGTYRGTGSRRIVVPIVDLVAGRGLALFVRCSGSGSLSVFGQKLVSCPSGYELTNAVPGTLLSSGALSVVSDPATSWTVVVVTEPVARSNGTTQSPVDGDVTGPDTAFRRHGQGSASIAFPAVRSRRGPWSVRIVCAGTYVRVINVYGSAVDGEAPARDGLRTGPCSADEQFGWISVPTVPRSVEVSAPAGTTWTIVLDPQP